MVLGAANKIQHLVVDTSAFIKNAPLQEIGETIVTAQEVVDEITSKRQLRRLVVLPYDLRVTSAFPENIHVVTEFAKKTGDYPSLSSTDIKVIALTYQLEKEHVGVEHLKTEPTVPRSVNYVKKTPAALSDLSGFYVPHKNDREEGSEGEDSEESYKTADDDSESEEEFKDSVTENRELQEKFASIETAIDDEDDLDDILRTVEDDEHTEEEEDEEDDDEGWITPSNVAKVKKQLGGNYVEEKPVVVACMTTDFAMQNVLKQMGLNVSTIEGKLIRNLRTYILRCYSCFKTTSIMTKAFCPKCGNNTLKRVAVSLDENGKQQIYINTRRPLTARGKKYSLPTPKGGKHSNNPVLVEDQPIPDQRPSKLARERNNPLDPDYIAGYSPFVMRDINSRSALLGIKPGTEIKHWMRKNPNEARRRRK